VFPVRQFGEMPGTGCEGGALHQAITQENKNRNNLRINERKQGRCHKTTRVSAYGLIFNDLQNKQDEIPSLRSE
jgi:hypothetical protein